MSRKRTDGEYEGNGLFSLDKFEFYYCHLRLGKAGGGGGDFGRREREISLGQTHF